MKNIRIPIILGLCLGILIFFSPGTVFCLSLMLLIILALHLISKEEERVFLIRLFACGITLRMFLVLLIQFMLIQQGKYRLYHKDIVYNLFGDDGMNTLVAWWYTKSVMGVPLDSYISHVVTGTIGDYGRSGYLYFLSSLYYILGYSPISVTFINCIIGVLAGIVYYFIAKDIASIRSAKITAILITFFPSLVLWSTINLKDPLIILVIGCILWVSLKLFKVIKFKYIILLFLFLYLQYTLRNWVVPISLATIGISYILIKVKGKVIFFVLVFMIIFFNRYPYFKNKLDGFKDMAVSYHIGVLSTGGATYRLYNDQVIDGKICSYGEFFQGFLKGWLHILFEPFLWRITSPSQLASYTQTLFLYCLFPFWILGIFIGLRKERNKSLILLLYLLFTGSTLSLAAGNIGTIFRLRDMLTPLILLFASIGIAKILYFKIPSFSIKQN